MNVFYLFCLCWWIIEIFVFIVYVFVNRYINFKFGLKILINKIYLLKYVYSFGIYFFNIFLFDVIFGFFKLFFIENIFISLFLLFFLNISFRCFKFSLDLVIFFVV